MQEIGGIYLRRGTREVREWWQPIIITRFTAKSFPKTDPAVRQEYVKID